MNGDFKNEDTDEYVKMLESESKKKLYFKIGIGIMYLTILLVSLFAV